jgi:hypothetical protein
VSYIPETSIDNLYVNSCFILSFAVTKKVFLTVELFLFYENETYKDEIYNQVKENVLHYNAFFKNVLISKK